MTTCFDYFYLFPLLPTFYYHLKKICLCIVSRYFILILISTLLLTFSLFSYILIFIFMLLLLFILPYDLSKAILFCSFSMINSFFPLPHFPLLQFPFSLLILPIHIIKLSIIYSLSFSLRLCYRESRKEWKSQV